MNRSALSLAALLAVGCSSTAPSPGAARQEHSSPIAISADGARLFVVHADADSVSMIDVASRSVDHEIQLGPAGAPPAVDAATSRFDPAVGPRALALSGDGNTLYVTGQRSSQVYVIDAQKGTLLRSAAVCAEPIGILVAPDDAHLFIACSQDDEVIEVDVTTLAVVQRVVTPRKPWALSWETDGSTLLATHLLGAGVSELTTSPFALKTTWAVPDRGPESDPTEPHGLVRGIYDALARPGTSEVWVAHLMLGTDTPQPSLVFNNTVFPALSILDAEAGSQIARLSVQVNTGDDGAFGDVVSGPRAIAFSDDGKYAFVVDTDSEDLLVVDATQRIETTLVRPLPGHLPEGIVWYQGELFVQERNTEDIVAFKVTEGASGPSVTQDGPAFQSLAKDPMPANLRLGQKLFYSANSDDVPTTQNHWVACATCHLEGRSDAVTWLFAQGPRDTPTNAGGMIDTGFLFRTADRSEVQDYWKTIDVEQGGDFQPGGSQEPLLDALANFVNYAIPVPVPPSTDETHTLRGSDLQDARSQGQAVFNQSGCATCHSGPAMTDSGMGNATLDLAGPVVTSVTAGGVLLHDVGTCVTDGPWPDVAHDDIDGHPRPGCAFDTPALRGVADSAPYLHDGSAATLENVLPIMLRASVATGQGTPTLTAADQAALVEFLRSL